MEDPHVDPQRVPTGPACGDEVEERRAAETAVDRAQDIGRGNAILLNLIQHPLFLLSIRAVEPRADAPVRNPGSQAALRAWTTGMRIGDIAPTFLMKADSNPARDLLRKVRAYSSTIYHDLKAEPEGYGEISIPDLPSKTGSRVDDHRAIMKFLAQSKVGVAISLGDCDHEPWGFDEIDCYKMAICAQTARLDLHRSRTRRTRQAAARRHPGSRNGKRAPR